MSTLRYSMINALRPTTKLGAGVEVRYHSVVTGLVYTVIATLDDAAGEIETEQGMTIPFHVGVFKIDRVDLPVMPQRLDRIEWIDPDDSSRVEWFQVLSDSAIDAVAPLGNFRDTWRINSKWVPSGDVSGQVLYGNAGGTVYGNADPEGTGYGSASR